MTTEKTDVQGTRLRRQQTSGDVDTGGAHALSPGAHFGIGIVSGVDHPRHASCNQGLCTRRRATVRGARFERYVGRRAARLVPSRVQREHFGVRSASAFMPALTDHPACAHQHAAHARIGIRRVDAQRGQP